MSRVVLDTNIIVSAALANDSVPGQVFISALDHGTILVSRSLIKELDGVLRRAKFDRYVSLEDRGEFRDALIHASDLIEITESIHVCRDPKDNQILELAICGSAEFIVTGDDDLLALNPFRGVQILKPAEFLKLST